MLFYHAFSAAGRGSQGTLESLRRQLGRDLDPACAEMDKEDAHAHPRPHTAGEGEAGMAVPKNLLELERALKEAVEGTRAVDDGTGLKDKGSEEFSTPRCVRDRRRVKPSAAFLTLTRDARAHAATYGIYEPPPPGIYKIKDDVESKKPRIKTTDFGERPLSRSAHAIAIEAEVQRLAAEDMPTEHLTKPCVSVELAEEIPARMKLRCCGTPDLGKCLARPSLASQSHFSYNVNTFTKGVLDGDKICSTRERQPCGDFGKTTVRPPPSYGKTYFEPGNIGKKAGNIDAVRQRVGNPGMPFNRQRPRQPMATDTEKKNGDSIIPDRSLARKCSATVPRVKGGTDFGLELDRPPLEGKPKEYHRTDDPEACDSVMEFSMTYDVSKAEKSLLRKCRSAEDFGHAVPRNRAAIGTRMHAQAGIPQENVIRSTEAMPLDEIHRKGTMGGLRGHPRVKTRNFERMLGRDIEKENCNSPSRKRDLSAASRFAREIREGESRIDPSSVSSLAGSVAQLRKTRSYVELKHAEPHQRPSTTPWHI